MKNILYYGCGLNVNHQLHPDKNSILCCPVELQIHKCLKNQHKLVSISLSHILWICGDDIVICGYKSKIFNVDIASVSKSNVISSSESRLVLINEDEVTICTSNDTKKLHFQYINDESKELNSNNKIIDVAVEDNSLIAINENGQLFSFGMEIPISVKIAKVCVGKEHCLALTSAGEVLSWGSGMKGQLGNGEIEVVENPEKIDALDGLKIVSVDCGGWHSIALSDSGDVYVWGWNDVGQLALPSKSLKSSGVKWDETKIFECQCHALNEKCNTESDEKEETQSESNVKHIEQVEEDLNLINVQAVPKLLEFWSVDVPVKKVACGDRHTAFLLENGTAWTAGWNMYGQLGIGSGVSQDEPQIVPIESVIDIYAGGWNTVFVVSKES